MNISFTGFYHAIFSLESLDPKKSLLNVLSSRKYNITSDFRDEIAYYIDSIYKTADFKDSSFVEDLIRRIELQMEETDGATAYKKDLAIDSTFVPYSKIVNRQK